MSYPVSTWRRLIVVGLLCSAFFSTVAAAERDESNVWQALRSGEGVAMIRHALAPGGGDPANFDLNDCSTQRNLSAKGRAQAANIGALFKAAGINRVRLFSSQWCRCIDTAELMDLGEVNPQPLLNSFFQLRELGPERLAGLREWLSNQDTKSVAPLVLVTHQVTITGLTGVYPSSGEIVVLRHPQAGDAAIEVIGTIETD